ncbi:Uncharacterised protein [Mycobacteroides abscessus subsp. abscessus]|nr:Uncharacterised protein [Mycobacteroides abscessus subsp. abscessus]
MIKGAERLSPTTALPNAGPATIPSKKLEPYNPWARPRISSGAMRTSSAAADTVNMVEPTPPTERNTSSCQ